MSSSVTPAEAVRSALPGARSWFEIYSRLTAAIPDGSEDAFRGAVWAFGFDPISPGDPERREREGSAFGAMFEIEGKRLPPRLHDVPDGDVDGWVDLAESIQDPRAAARLRDLLWERRQGGRPDQHARAACRALLELSADEQWEDMEAADGLVRGLELATSVRDDDLREDVVKRMCAVAEAEIASDENRPGIPLTLLSAIAELPEAALPAGLPGLLEAAERRYGSDPHHFQTVLDLQARVADEGAVRDLRRRQVSRWREAAGDAEGILRMTWLEQALDLSRTHGLKKEAEEIRVELGSISDEDLDLKEVSVEAKIETAKVEEFIGSFLRSDDWKESLTRFGIYGPPGGEPDQVNERIAERRKKSPLEFLVTRVRIDPDSSQTIVRATDDAMRERIAASEERMFPARFWGVMAVDILRRFADRYGQPGHDELTAFFTTPFIDGDTADRIARALDLWWQGHADEAAHLLAPRLETVIRQIARVLGLPVISEPADGRPGRTRPLGTLFTALEGRMPTAGWHEYLFFLLADPLGLNLRNVVAHGLRAKVSEDDAALLIHAACFLRLVEPGATEPGDLGHAPDGGDRD